MATNTATDDTPQLTDEQLRDLELTGVHGYVPTPTAPAPVARAASGLPMVGAAPEVASNAAAPALPTGGMPVVARPTAKQSIAAGMAEHGDTAKQEGKAQYEAGMPQITASPATHEGQAQTLAQLQYQKLHPLGGDVSEKPGFWGKLEHGIGKAANIAGDVLAPGITAGIPGSDLNRELQEKQAWKRMGEADTNTERQAEAANLESLTAAREKPADAGWKPIGEPKQDPVSGQWSQLSEKTDAQGNAQESWQPLTGGPALAPTKMKPPTSEEDKQFVAKAEQDLASGAITGEDRTKLAGMQRAAKLSGLGPEVAAQIGDPPVPADYPKGTKDPAYVAANKAWGKSAEQIKNEEAGASGAARGAGFNASRPVQVLDANGNLTYVTAAQAEQQGLGGASEGTKIASKIAQINDIHNASDEVRKAIKAGGNANFTPGQVAKLTLAMHEQDPTLMMNEVSNLANSGLNPKQQDLVTWLAQLQERALSLRAIAGMGQGSETTRLAILKALPSITSGNTDMATKQLDAFDNMVSNLEKGIPKQRGAGAIAGGFEIPKGAPGAPKEDGKVLKMNGKVVARSEGGNWVAP